MSSKGFEILRTPEQREAHKTYVDSLKREEIRKIVEGYLFYDKLDGYGDEDVTKLLKELSRVGVVIKVDDQTIQVEIPADGKRTGLKVPYHLENLGKNIVAVEPLIEVQDE